MDSQMSDKVWLIVESSSTEHTFVAIGLHLSHIAYILCWHTSWKEK